MGVRVRQKGSDGAWWVFVSHRGRRRSQRIGSYEAALFAKVEIEKQLVGATPAVQFPPNDGDDGVYVIAERGGTGPMVKVGVTANVAGRLSNIQTGNPRLVAVDFFWRCRDARRVERAVHMRLSAWSVRNEWFRCSLEDAVRTIFEVVGERGAVDEMSEVA